MSTNKRSITKTKVLIIVSMLIIFTIGSYVGYMYFFSKSPDVVYGKVTNTKELTLINGPDGISVSVPPNTVPSGTTVTVQKLDPAKAPTLPRWANSCVSLYNFTIDQPINGSVTIRIPFSDSKLAILGHYNKGQWEAMPFKVEGNKAVVDVKELSLFSWLDVKISWLSDKIVDFLTLRWLEKETLPVSDFSIKVYENNSLGLIVGSVQFISDNEWRIFIRNEAPLPLDIYPVTGNVVEVKRTSIFVSAESENGMVISPGDIGEWVVEFHPNETATFEAYFSDSAVAALFADVIPLGRFSRAIWECILFTENGRKMTWNDIKGLLVVPAIAEATKKIEEIQKMPILEKGSLTFIRLVLPGAKKILFTSNGSIYTINPDGTNLIKLDEGRKPSWSPTGEKIIYEKVVGYSGFWRTEVVHVFIINPDGSNKKDLGRTYLWSCKWSPDGKKLLYWANGTIFLINSDGTGKIELDNSTRKYEWSPNGEKIAYINIYDNLCVINADGTGKVRLAPEVSTEYTPQWGAYGKRIAYEREGTPYAPYEGWKAWYVISVDGTDEIKLGIGEHDFPKPTWSPNGKAIAYTSWVLRGAWSINYRDLNIAFFNEEGKLEKNVTLVEGGSFYEPLLWSPDSKKILYWHYTVYTGTDSYIVNIENGKHVGLGVKHDISFTFINDISFAWSPAGDKITYWSVDWLRKTNATFLVNADGTDKIGLREASNFQWSPDGRKFAYTYAEKFGKEVLGYYIHIVNADGTGKIEIEGQSPVWSPDGEKIAYIRKGVVYVCNADGTNEIMLGEGTNPLWSPAFKEE